MRKVKHNTLPPVVKISRVVRLLMVSLLVGAGFLAIVAGTTMSLFEKRYEGRIYPNVFVGSVAFGGKSPQEVEEYWLRQSEPFGHKQIELRFNGEVATASGAQLGLAYDATLSATQAYVVGRTGHLLSDLYAKYLRATDLPPLLVWNYQLLDDMLTSIADRIEIPVQDALFRFETGKVTMFKPSRDGRQVNLEETKKSFRQALITTATRAQDIVVITVAVDTIKPSITTDRVNSFGIRELIGRGYSEFSGSIPGRIHNVALAANRLNGLLIKPGEVFSFNKAVGDISAATGYQTAYIIKDSRTVLGDGGGVCQVSTTLFRAALNAGLPIVERRAHAYRVHYYEEAGYKPGLDATVFAPSVDLQFKNDTPAYILIQTKTDTTNLSLTFELYGTGDGRKAEILNHQVWGVTAPPPPLYQDDPTLPPGVVKQVDFAAWGARTSFQYKVVRGTEVLQDTTFNSNFRPWQAIYLRGPQP